MARIPLPEHLLGQPFTSKQGLAAGLGRKRMAGRDIQNPFRGTHTTADLTLFELCRTFATRMPQHAFFCGITAAGLRGVPLPRRFEAALPLHVGVPRPHRAPKSSNVAGHSFTVDAGEIELFAGLPVSSPARLWCELGSVLGLSDLVAAGDFLLRWRAPLVTMDELRAASESYPGRIGAATRRTALGLVTDRSESPAESRVRVVLVRGGIRGLVANLPITTSGGYRYRADLAIPGKKVIIEYQSDLHLTREAFGRDRTRISRLTADGWLVIEVTALDLQNPVELVRRIQRLISSRA